MISLETGRPPTISRHPPTREIRRVVVEHERVGPQAWTFNSREWPELAGGGRTLRSSIEESNVAVGRCLHDGVGELLVEHRVAAGEAWAPLLTEYRRLRDDAERATAAKEHSASVAIAALAEAGLRLRDIAHFLDVSHQTVAEWSKAPKDSAPHAIPVEFDTRQPCASTSVWTTLLT